MAEAIVPALRLTIVIGATFTEVITWAVDGVLRALPVGTTAEVKVRPVLNSTTVLARFSTSPGATEGLITLTDPGLTTLSMTDENTALLTPAKDAVFDIKYSFTDGSVIVKLSNGMGRCDIRTAVTRT